MILKNHFAQFSHRFHFFVNKLIKWFCQGGHPMIQNKFSHKFQRKRNWTRYHEDIVLVEEIFHAFDEGMKLTEIQNQTDVSANILTRWKKKYMANKSYRPGQQYGVWRRRFTKEQEEAVADFIRIQYIIPGLVIKRKQLCSLLLELWKSLDPKRVNMNEPFSYHYVSDFCERNGLSFRNMRKKKRSEINQEEVNEFAKLYLNALMKYNSDDILNMDKTSWNYVFMRNQVLSIKGQEEVNAQLPDDYRRCFTVIATISRSGGKYPPVFIAQGKTNECHKQFGDMTSNPNKYEILHSNGGNTSESCMIEYLKLLRKWKGKDECVLLCDRYRSHITDAVKEEARKNKIELIFIPTSGTEKFQPLDIRVFGILKSIASSKFDDFLWDRFRGFTKSEAADLFLACWKKLPKEAILKAWTFEDISEPDDKSIDDETDNIFDENIISENEWEEEEDEDIITSDEF